jgi:allophanate hydrolase subunit 2
VQEDASPAAPSSSAPIRVVLGPDLDRFERRFVESLLSDTFLVAASSDRVGMRLNGPRLGSKASPAALSAPMVRGAIQVTPSGELIVLGPDHPTMGGYPVIATVVRRHLGWLAVRTLGEPVQFVM